MTSLGSTSDGRKIVQDSGFSIASGSGTVAVNVRFSELTRVDVLTGLTFKTQGPTTVEQETYSFGTVVGQDTNVVGLTLDVGAAGTVTAYATAIGY